MENILSFLLFLKYGLNIKKIIVLISKLNLISLRKFQIGTQWRWSPQIIKTELWIFPCCIFDSESLFPSYTSWRLISCIKGWIFWGLGYYIWFLWGLKSESIKSQRYGLIEEDLVKGYMENWDQYKRMIDASLWSIIVFLFWHIKV